MKDDAVYMRYILECIRRIEENSAAGKAQFMASHTLQDAVLRNLQTLTESTQRLSAEIKATRPDIDWRRISAFRNVVVHNYLGIDMEQIWTIIQQDVPQLHQAVAAMLLSREDNK